MRNALALFGSTSPSYLILQSLDKCNQVLSEGYPLRLLQCCGYLTRLRRELNEAAAAKHCPGRWHWKANLSRSRWMLLHWA